MVERKDVEAALEARRELGPEYEDEIVDALAEKIGRRLDERLQAQPPAPRRPDHSLGLALGSIALGIPVTAIVYNAATKGTTSLILAIVVWIAIAAINIAYNRR